MRFTAQPERDYVFICSNVTNLTPAYVYTVGLCTFDLPEVFISGNMSEETAMGIITKLVGQWNDTAKIRLGRLPSFLNVQGKPYPVEVVEVDPKAAGVGYTTMIASTHPEIDHRLVQIFWPDEHGRLPWDAKYNKQPEFRQHALAVKQSVPVDNQTKEPS